MELQKYIACICEGAAERVIMNVLLDNNKLKFTREDLLEEDLIVLKDNYSYKLVFLLIK